MQNGWLRANERKLDAGKSTLLEPVPTFRAADVAPLPRGRFTEVTVPLYYEGHAYRGARGSGSRSPRRAGPARVGVRRDAARRYGEGPDRALAASSRRGLILPVVPGVSVPTPLPPCPGCAASRAVPTSAYTNQAVFAGVNLRVTRSLTPGIGADP